MNMFKKLFLPLLLAGLYGCGSDNNTRVDDMETPVPAAMVYSFSVSITNLTHAQPLSPIGIALHQDGAFWEIGSPASEALEQMAESGDNSALLAQEIVMTSTSDSMPLPPGNTIDLMVDSEQLNNIKLSLFTMMVNTNDGFSGLNAIDVSQLAVGEALNVNTMAYDAGTEANSESSGTIPGPADGGEGFNSERNDSQIVSAHSGVVGQDDGLTQSVLNGNHKFDNPIMTITITRMQ
ncbi:spondin domain-containing protein [Colwellia asteriadis]|uniref:Spondin domain-containing protein n=2 Tax=Colwellia asteriadis TaxID=517723 RepID=A0ABN1L7P5_9GAMM